MNHLTTYRTHDWPRARPVAPPAHGPARRALARRVLARRLLATALRRAADRLSPDPSKIPCPSA